MTKQLLDNNINITDAPEYIEKTLIGSVKLWFANLTENSKKVLRTNKPIEGTSSTTTKPIEKSIITAVKGNLIYQKFKFIISANYSVAVTDRNIDKSLVLYWNETNSISNLNQYYITGKINEKEYLILLNTGQEENYIAKYLVKNEEIKTDNNICPDLPRSLINNKNIAEKEIILGVRKIQIEFEVKEEMQDREQKLLNEINQFKEKLEIKNEELEINNIDIEETDNYESEDSETYTEILTNTKNLEINEEQKIYEEN